MISTVGVCRLCLEVRPLQQSHIVSAFVYRWFKRARIYQSRPLVMHDPAAQTFTLVQDGLKPRMLCAECE